MHLGRHQTTAVVAAPFLPDPVPSPLAGAQRFIAHRRSHSGLFLRLAVLARGNHRLRASLSYSRMAALGVIGAVDTHAGYRLNWRYLRQQLGQQRRIARAVACGFNGWNLHAAPSQTNT